MLEWSKYFQNPEYLAVYRMMTLNHDFLELIKKWIGLHREQRVLDVGCGTGEFTAYLAGGTKKCEYHGLDINSDFISYAKSRKNESSNTFVYQVGDASSLPYPDEYFDIVTSYTFLTNMPNGKRAVEEMKRVVKKEGTISSITSQSLRYSQNVDGVYPLSHADYYYEYVALKARIERAYEKIQPFFEYVKYGTPPERIPRLFVDCELRNIQLHPLAWTFSLSDSSCSNAMKIRYIRLLRSAEESKVKAYADLPEFQNLIPKADVDRYVQLLYSKEKALLDEVGENKIWEWYGGAQILVVGRK